MKPFIVCGLLACAPLGADLVEFKNGDRLHGKVLSLTETELKLRNDNQGVITVPREGVVTIRLGEAKGASAAAIPNADEVLRQFEGGGDPAKVIEQVRNQFLAGATPEAQRMFREMAQGVLSGQVGIGEIRSQAETALRDLRQMKQELGDDDVAAMLGTYEAILENFLGSAPTPAEKPAAPKQPAPAAPKTAN